MNAPPSSVDRLQPHWSGEDVVAAVVVAVLTGLGTAGLIGVIAILTATLGGR